MIVISGALRITAEQINYALAHGFGGVALKTDRLVDETAAKDERNKAIREALVHLSEGRNPLLSPHSVRTTRLSRRPWTGSANWASIKAKPAK